MRVNNVRNQLVCSKSHLSSVHRHRDIRVSTRHISMPQRTAGPRGPSLHWPIPLSLLTKGLAMRMERMFRPLGLTSVLPKHKLWAALERLSRPTLSLRCHTQKRYSQRLRCRIWLRRFSTSLRSAMVSRPSNLNSRRRLLRLPVSCSSRVSTRARRNHR